MEKPKINWVFVGLCAIAALWLLKLGLVLPVAIVAFGGALAVIATALEQDSALKRYCRFYGSIVMSGFVAVIALVAVNKLLNIDLVEELFGSHDSSYKIWLFEIFLAVASGNLGYRVVFYKKDNEAAQKRVAKYRRFLAAIIIVALAVMIWQVKKPDLEFLANSFIGRMFFDLEASAKLHWGVAKVPAMIYTEAGLPLEGGIKAGEVVQRLTVKPKPVGTLFFVRIKTAGERNDFSSGREVFVDFTLFNWTQDRPLEVAAIPTPKPVPAVKQSEPAVKQPVEIEPLTIPDEELQPTKASSVAKRPTQEATVHFKAGQRTLTGVIVKPGDFIRYSGATAAFQIESESESGFAQIKSDKIFIAVEAGELKIYGLDRDGQVHIRVVSQR